MIILFHYHYLTKMFDNTKNDDLIDITRVLTIEELEYIRLMFITRKYN